MFLRNGMILLLVATLLPLSACTLWPEKKNPGWEHATGLEQIERLYWKELQAKNWKEIEARTASNYTHTSTHGVQDKQQQLAAWKKYGLVEHSLGEFHIVSHGDTAVVHYLAIYRYQDDRGRTYGPAKQRLTSVWQHQKSGWVLIADTVVSLEL